MARYSTKSLYICTLIFVIVSLTSVTASLSLEELSLRIQQLELNDGVKDARLLELELKVQHLEIKLVEQGRECQSSYAAQPALQGKTAILFEKQVMEQRNAIFRTCRELRQVDPSLSSGMYWIDPDGQGLGDDPIYVKCDMTTGKTSVSHDSENPTNVGHCTDPGCYSKLINYSASMRQMSALAELSNECHQSIKYECNFAPLEVNGDAMSWWNDRNGVAQYFWSGSNNSIHTCQCGIDHNCVELRYLCNCDSAAPVPLNDSGVITEKSYLPITRLNFGRTQLESSSGIYTLGKFECTGQVSLNGMPTSCSHLWKIGHTLSGIYSIMGSEYVESVYCDFTRLPYEQGYQTLIGYSDVKSSLVYFYVQKNVPKSVTGPISFELTRLNIGGAIDASSGIFTAPRNGIYSFSFTGVGYYPPSTNSNSLRIALVLNDSEVGRGFTVTQDDSSTHTISLNSVLELKTGDQVWISIAQIEGAAQLHETTFHYTHYTGCLLHENMASSFNLTNNLSH